MVVAALVGLLLVQPGELNGLVRGAVVDERGLPVVGAQIDVLCSGRTRRAHTSHAGTFVLRDLPTVDCRLEASMAGGVAVEAIVRPVEGSGPPPMVLQLEMARFSEQIVVTPSRGLVEWVFRVPETVTTTSREALSRRPYTLLGQALREQPGVMVQQTTAAQVSPVIRGFTGQGNLYLVDGVRLNTSVWRSGPSQYFAWIDADAVGSLEVVRGSGSVQYGSDGLGGAIQVVPARPSLRSPGMGTTAAVSVELTGASGDRMGGLRLGGRIESPAVSATAGVGASTIGDLRTGGGRDSRAAVTRFFGLPDDVPGGRLAGTGYSMRSGYSNVVVKVGQSGVILGTYLGQTQRGVNRYDRLDGGDGLSRSGFAPQRLDLALVRYEGGAAGVVDRWSATVSMNRQEDGRFEQARPGARLDTQQSVTTAWGYQTQATRYAGTRHQTLVGGEVYEESTHAERQLLEADGRIVAARPDVPTGTRYSTIGAFAQQVSEVWRDRLWLRGGVRYSRYLFEVAADPSLGVTAERVPAQAFTFQSGGVLSLTRFLNLTVNVSRGFRAANASDLGGIGLTGGGGLEVAPARARGLGAFIGTNEGATAVSTGRRVGRLRPEMADTFEAGLKAHGARFSAAGSVFVTRVRNAIQRRALIVDQTVVGLDLDGFVITRQDADGRLFVAEDARPIVTRVNVDRARISGFDAEATVVVGRGWTIGGHASMANGRTAAGDYLRRMPPASGGLSVRWNAQRHRAWIEAVATVARPQTSLNAGDLGDARIGARRTAASVAAFFNGPAVDRGLVAGGRLLATNETLAEVQARVLGGSGSAPLFTQTDGFVLFGLRAGWTMGRDLHVTIIGENLFDRNYRWHGSGVDGTGRSVQARVRYHLPVFGSR